MATSFEAKLTAASSAEIFKSAKALLKNKCLLNAYRDENGNMNAVFEHQNRYEYVSVQPGDNIRSVCSCAHSGDNCVHAIAAVMHFGRFNTPAPPPEKESKARFAGLKYQNFEELAMQENSRPQAHIVINIE
ncbi:MAG: hypothetical protein PHV59_03750, partial [Victivallales bacterium]|nr:hypothetical protein [Victivallales bacterium]